MTAYYYIIIVFLAVLMASCSGTITSEKVKEETKEAFDKAEEHIRSQTEDYDKLLHERLEKLNEKIVKLEEVSHDSRQKMQEDLSSPIVNLHNEKEMLEIEIKSLKYRTDSSIHILKQDWTNYDSKLNMVLNDLNGRYNRIKEEANAENVSK